MKLKTLLEPWVNLQLPDNDILGLHNDSRQIGPGFLFLAYPGVMTDGRLYIEQALQAGACAVVYEPDNWPTDYPHPDSARCIALPKLANYLAQIASRFYNYPSRQLYVVGVTGTNGKTTIAYQLTQAHELLNRSAIYIGTLGYGPVASLTSLANTTPDALCLQNIFQQYLQQDTKHVCMEVSSHGLHQQRVAAVDFSQAIFTNLTLDHLDYHHTMDAYAEAKAQLFTCPTLQWAIINNDDSYAKWMIDRVTKPCELLTYGLSENSDIRAVNWTISLDGTMISITSPWGPQQLQINGLGFFNIYNTLAIFASLMVSGYPVADVVAVMSRLAQAPGRMEIVARQPYILVDYAHTPDALQNVLKTLNEVKRGRIIAVFGCGGDRDKSKRPLMGAIAAQFADVVIATSDNPRNEEPMQIIKDISGGISSSSAEIYKIVDRKQAIARAIELAESNDIILVAGKGHESYQQIGITRHEFSDSAVILQLLAKKTTGIL